MFNLSKAILPPCGIFLGNEVSTSEVEHPRVESTGFDEVHRDHDILKYGLIIQGSLHG